MTARGEVSDRSVGSPGLVSSFLQGLGNPKLRGADLLFLNNIVYVIPGYPPRKMEVDNALFVFGKGMKRVFLCLSANHAIHFGP